MTRRPRVVIDGAGPAGTTLAWLLLERGAEVRLHGRRPRPGRIVAISRETFALAAELWRVPPDRLAAGCPLTQRRTAWTSRYAEAGPADAVACDAGRLAGRFLDLLAERGLEWREDAAGEDGDWIVRAGGRPVDAGDICAGVRVAQACRMARIPSGHAECMTVAATDAGWLFGCPHPDGGLAVVLVQPQGSVADAGEALQATVETVWPGCGECVEAQGAPQPCAPLLARQPADTRFLRVGDAALAIDALRGDGVGYAIRGALLAQAAIAAEATDAALPHYAGRLREVFRAHLRNCIGHYATAWNAALWEGEIARMADALAVLGPVHVPEQHLDGRNLRPADQLPQHELRESTA